MWHPYRLPSWRTIRATQRTQHPKTTREFEPAFRGATISILQLPSPFGAKRQEGGVSEAAKARERRSEVFACKPELRRMGLNKLKGPITDPSITEPSASTYCERGAKPPISLG